MGSEFELRSELLSWEFVDSLQKVHELLKQKKMECVCALARLFCEVSLDSQSGLDSKKIKNSS